MQKIKVMVNGLPGKMAEAVVKQVIEDDRVKLIPYSLTGPEITQPSHTVGGIDIHLMTPEKRKTVFPDVIKEYAPFITADYTHPSAINANAEFYCNQNLPFVMGTTGGDRELLLKTVEEAGIPAVIAPNMAKQIVGLQAMMEFAAQNFPGIFKGYTLGVKESHQKGKADTSGTAVAMVKYFNDMGIPFSVDQIKKERDPEIQKNKWEVPEEHLPGHAWHTYTLISNDNTVKFEFTHNVNGRGIYAKGTIDAICFLSEKIKDGIYGKVYNMIDVLKGR